MAKYDGQLNSPGAPGNGAALAQRVYGQIERGQYNRPGPLGAGIVQPEVFMAPYPGTKPGQPTEFFPLGNPAAGYRFEAARPMQNTQLAQGLQGAAGNLGGMMSASSSSAPAQQGQPAIEEPSQYGPKPFNLDLDGEDNRLKYVRGSANIQLDPNQMVRVGGEYIPGYRDQMGIPTSAGYAINASYQTPGVNINARYRRTPQAGASIYGGLDARF
jgi:hypothetical protein